MHAGGWLGKGKAEGLRRTDVESAVDEAEGGGEPVEGFALAFHCVVVDEGGGGDGHVDELEEDVAGEGGDGGGAVVAEGWAGRDVGRRGQLFVDDDHGGRSEGEHWNAAVVWEMTWVRVRHKCGKG
jgi:hypothetical protein